jgi:hypothetical protein
MLEGTVKEKREVQERKGWKDTNKERREGGQANSFQE